jgi:predicted transcriptional regulator of viral defense system
MENNLTVSKYLDGLARNGQFHFVLKEVATVLSLKEASVSVSLSRLSKQGKIKMIRKGFGIITAQTSGVLHPSYFIDSMMSYLGSKYYVGLLTAASFWGASHQSPMVYYVVAEKVIKPVDLGKMKIEFITKNNLDEISEVKKVAGTGGYFLVSTPELTAIDLIRFPKKSGHLNNVATILEDLFEKIDFHKLLDLCRKESVPTASIQRLGFIFDTVLGRSKEASGLEDVLHQRKMSRVVLSVSKKKEKIKFTDYPYNEKWGIYQNTTVEPD